MTTGSVCVKDENGNKYRIDKNDPKYLSGELQYIAVGHVTVKDDNGKTLRVKVDDERYLSGDLISIWNGKKHNDETKNKMSAKAKMRTQEKNSQFGTCWIFSDTLKENKKILKSDLQHFLNLNWLKGRKY